MKITVLGCGALGQLWLSALYQQGHDVQGWIRIAQPFCAVNVISPEGIAFNRNMPTNDPEHLAQSELLLVTLKAWQVSGAISTLMPMLNDNCAILLLHNGMGTVDELPLTVWRFCRAQRPMRRVMKATQLSMWLPERRTSVR